jgi:hypothetical protein
MILTYLNNYYTNQQISELYICDAIINNLKLLLPFYKKNFHWLVMRFVYFWICIGWSWDLYIFVYYVDHTINKLLHEWYSCVICTQHNPNNVGLHRTNAFSPNMACENTYCAHHKSMHKISTRTWIIRIPHFPIKTVNASFTKYWLPSTCWGLFQRLHIAIEKGLKY